MSTTVTAPDPNPRVGSRFETLYRSSVADAYAYACVLLRDRSAAEDVTALAFERAFRRWSSFDPRRGSERGWLFGIVRHAAVDELRRRRRLAPFPPGEESGEADPQEPAEELVRRATIRSALAKLSVRDREMIALKFHVGLTNAELARVVGISETNAGTRLHRAIQQLRRACDETS